MSSASGRPVLIVGAGPTGLVLALWLTRLGVRVRIVDKTAGPGTTSRALAVQARTLELYRPLGLATAVGERGVRAVAINFWRGGGRVARAVFGDGGVGRSPFPYAVIFPQDEHERLLIERLGESGVTVERRLQLVGFADAGDHVRARLRHADGADETCEAAYLAGCDGAGSTVREQLGVGFPGGTYEHLFYVADVQAPAPAEDGQLHGTLDEAEFLLVFPLAGERRARLIGVIPDAAASRRGSLTWDDVGTDVVARMGITVERVNWFSTYHVHHRVADRFRQGRAFLLGDAAHIHSPVGGQGMNTGIGDAVNLAWKLADVLHGRAPAALLDSYEPERIGFARRLVATTDRAFTLVTSRGALARLVRRRVVPVLVPLLFRARIVRRTMFRIISQTAVSYRKSPLSAGRAGRVRGGDRLPWVEHEDNFAPLATPVWQVHLYGRATPELEAACRERQLPLHVFRWRHVMRRAGLRRDAVYLVRPDGYVALADAEARATTLARYLDVHLTTAAGHDRLRTYTSIGHQR
ncbi:MAG TPA: FAD-dependent monooxygenase [Methylomirabilota bacterium]|nr:FAD-dependent monooxygenase [Methylomirabilota bacterium]